MKIFDLPKIQLPSDMDEECIEICNVLNRLPNTETADSCQGHMKHPFWVFFKCTNIDVLTRLGRAVDPRYSDGLWEIVLDDSDTNPRGRFWLRALHMYDPATMQKSVGKLIENILYWFDDKFDEYFNEWKFKVGQKLKRKGGDGYIATVMEISEMGYHCDNAYIPYPAQDYWDVIEN